MNIIAKIGIYTVMVTALLSCAKESDFPNTPVLEFRDFKRISPTEAIWVLGFTDGDGDVGVRNKNDSDNFIVDIYVVKNGVGALDSNLKASNYRVPVVQGVRTAKGVEGKIEITINGLDFLKAEGYDSIYYSGYLIDRSFNASNTVYTPVFSTN